MTPFNEVALWLARFCFVNHLRCPIRLPGRSMFLLGAFYRVTSARHMWSQDTQLCGSDCWRKPHGVRYPGGSCPKNFGGYFRRSTEVEVAQEPDPQM
jgi:hypothetical protein